MIDGLCVVVHVFFGLGSSVTLNSSCDGDIFSQDTDWNNSCFQNTCLTEYSHWDGWFIWLIDGVTLNSTWFHKTATFFSWHRTRIESNSSWFQVTIFSISQKDSLFNWRFYAVTLNTSWLKMRRQRCSLTIRIDSNNRWFHQFYWMFSLRWDCWLFVADWCCYAELSLIFK